METRARIHIQVVAGLLPDQPLEELTKHFVITSDAWYRQGRYENRPADAEMEVMKTYGLAQEYMRTLWNPQRVNWVRCDWLYF